jgi:hypothetical protein
VARHIFQRPARCGYTLRVTSHKHLIHLSTLHQHSKFHYYLSDVFRVWKTAAVCERNTTALKIWTEFQSFEQRPFVNEEGWPSRWMAFARNVDILLIFFRYTELYLSHNLHWQRSLQILGKECVQ